MNESTPSAMLEVGVQCETFNGQLYLPKDIRAVRSTAHLALEKEKMFKQFSFNSEKSPKLTVVQMLQFQSEQLTHFFDRAIFLPI